MPTTPQKPEKPDSDKKPEQPSDDKAKGGQQPWPRPAPDELGYLNGVVLNDLFLRQIIESLARIQQMLVYWIQQNELSQPPPPGGPPGLEDPPPPPKWPGG